MTGLTNGMQVFFRVTATNAGGESAASTQASATPQVPTPGVPPGLSLTPGNGQLAVSWTAVLGATRYTVYYSTSPITSLTASGVTAVRNLTGTSTTVIGLTNGRRYYVRVTATNASGESAASSEASATPQPPAPGTPLRPNVRAGNGQVTVSWTAVPVATSYTVYYSTSPITSLTASGVTAVRNLTNTSTTVTSLTNGVRVYVRVTASNAGGESAASTQAWATPQAPLGLVPPRLTTWAGNGQVAVSWTAVPVATSYTVYYSTSPITSLTASGVTAVRNLTNTSTTVTSLTNGVRYYVRVTASNAGGESAPSRRAVATPQARFGDAPTGLSLTAGNGQVEASWTAVPGARRYTIYYSTSPINYINLSDASRIGIITDTSVTVTGLPNGTRYYFRVNAYNGSGDSLLSRELSAIPRPAP